ncbi:MAG: hypothetical protein SFY80_06155 [Verrucomicrobiota bacterium]|nr:hypothetical protein [Verrucomicrobiota bacterium]
MLSAKDKGIFIEFNQFSILAAVTSGLEPPLKVETLKEFSAGLEPAKLQEQITELTAVKKNSYARGHCGIYPPSRFIRRHTVDQPAKMKDANFFSDLLNNQFRIDPEKNSVAILNALDGSTFNLEKGYQNQKELLICGALTEDLQKAQTDIVQCSVYPETIQLGNISLIAGLKEYSRWAQFNQPTMVLEVTPDTSSLYIFSSEQFDVSRPIPYGLNSMFPLIQQELGLKDEDSARKLFYSNTFDFTEMGPTLLRKMLKELQASTGFYEVQTGQTIGQVFLSLLPKNLGWIAQVISKALGVKVLSPDYNGWLKHRQITVSDSVQLETLDSRWFGMFSLMGNYSPDSTASSNGEKKN